MNVAESLQSQIKVELPAQDQMEPAPPQQVSIDRFETIYFGSGDQMAQPGSDVVETARRSIGEIVTGKLEAVQKQSEESLKIIQNILNRIHQPGHQMSVQEAMQFQAAELSFVETQAYTATVAKKSGDAIKTLFTNQ